MSEWKKVRLGEVCDVRDGTHASPKEASSGRLLLTSKNLIGGRLSFEKSYLISNDDADEIDRRSKVDQWDVLFSMIGTVGEIAVVKENPEFAIKNVGLFKTNGNKELAHWVYYYFRSPIGKMQVYERLQGTTQQYITLGQLREFPIPLPPLPTQRKIAAVLGALDDKIENNRKICANLEAQAQAIFKSWFVDFEPFGGKMPQGWKMGKLGDVVDTVLGGTPSRTETAYWGGDIAWINSGKVNDFRIIEASEYITKEGLDSSAAKLMPAKTVVLAITGATLGQISILEIESAANQSVIGILENRRMPYEFIYPLVVDKINDLLNCQTGGAQQHINKNDVNGLPILIPDEESMIDYKNLTKSLYEEIACVCFETKTLAATRDALLPKLMSGEIDVEKVKVA